MPARTWSSWGRTPSSEPGQWRRDRAALEEAEATLASFPEVLGEAADDELSGLYARLNLDEGAEEALRSLIDRHNDYEAAVEAERARAVIDAVRTICRDGRQVLYLTARADEVQK